MIYSEYPILTSCTQSKQIKENHDLYSCSGSQVPDNTFRYFLHYIPTPNNFLNKLIHTSSQVFVGSKFKVFHTDNVILNKVFLVTHSI